MQTYGTWASLRSPALGRTHIGGSLEARVPSEDSHSRGWTQAGVGRSKDGEASPFSGDVTLIPKVDIVIATPHFQMGTLRIRDRYSLVQGHAAGKW